MGDTNRSVNILIKAKNDASKSIDGVLSSLASLQGVAIAAAAGAAYMAVAFTKVTQAAMQQENADVRLAAALASIGKNTAANREHLNRFISQLEDITGVSDEAIQSAVALLAQLGELSGQGLEDATRAALDLSAALGMDLQSAATLVSKAAQGNTAALTRYGIVLDENIPKTEKGAAALKLLHDRFGGAAEAAGTTMGTALARIANAFDNLEQAIGKAVVENEAFRGLLEVVNRLLKDATGFVEGNTGALDAMVTAASRATIAVLKFGLEIANWQARQAEAVLSAAQFGAALVTLASAAPALFEKIFGVGGEEAKAWARAGAEIILQLQKVKGVATDVASATAAGIKSVEETLGKLGKGSGSKLDSFKNNAGGAAGEVQKLGEVATTALPPLEGLDALLDRLGLESMPSLEQASRDVDAALAAMVEQFEAGALSPEQFDLLLAAITQITEQLPQWSEDMSAAGNSAGQLKQRMQEIGDVIRDQVTGAALQLSDTVIDAALGAKVAWGQFFKQLLADLVKAIARFYIIQALTALFTGGASLGAGATGAAVGGGGGGVITGFSGLGGVLDSFQPAQGVLPSVGATSGFGLTAPGGLNTQPGSGPSQSGALQMFNQILPVRNRESEIADLISDISTAVERRGYHLVASRVVA